MALLQLFMKNIQIYMKEEDAFNVLNMERTLRSRALDFCARLSSQYHAIFRFPSMTRCKE